MWSPRFPIVVERFFIREMGNASDTLLCCVELALNVLGEGVMASSEPPLGLFRSIPRLLACNATSGIAVEFW
jgi:hypothetical protein